MKRLLNFCKERIFLSVKKADGENIFPLFPPRSIKKNRPPFNITLQRRPLKSRSMQKTTSEIKDTTCVSG
jgi:hypothetical protein